MAVEEKKVKLLEEAFSQFNATSSELEQSYRLLKKEVHRLKKKLQESQREKEVLREVAERNHRLAAVGEMAARMAHELRNPLGSIELFSALLQKEIVQTSKDPEKIAWGTHLSNAVNAMNYTITNLLLFTGKPSPEFQKADLKHIIADLLDFSQHLFEQNRIEIFQKIDRHLKPIWCDEDLLRQVLLNIIINAIDAMPHGGALKIGAYTTDDDKQETVITLSDTGGGISKEHLPKIFDPFFTTKKTGTGLGLAIAQNAIAAHNGVIQVHRRPDHGTVFSICLPCRKGKSA